MTTETTEAGPLMYHGGQPFSVESAAAALKAFDADAEKVKGAIGGDVALQQERAALWQMARGMQPGGVPAVPADGTGVLAQMNEREAAIVEARIDTYAKHIPLNEEARAQIKRGLCTQQEHDNAKREVARMLADPEFGRKVLAGNMDAKERWHTQNLIAAMQVAAPDYDWSADTVDKYR